MRPHSTVQSLIHFDADATDALLCVFLHAALTVILVMYEIPNFSICVLQMAGELCQERDCKKTAKEVWSLLQENLQG